MERSFTLEIFGKILYIFRGSPLFSFLPELLVYYCTVGVITLALWSLMKHTICLWKSSIVSYKWEVLSIRRYTLVPFHFVCGKIVPSQLTKNSHQFFHTNGKRSQL